MDGAVQTIDLNQASGAPQLALPASGTWWVRLRVLRAGGLVAELGTERSAQEPYDGVGGGGLTVLLTWESGTISSGAALPAAAQACARRAILPATRPLCGPAAEVTTNGATCAEHAQYRMNQYSETAAAAETTWRRSTPAPGAPRTRRRRTAALAPPPPPTSLHPPRPNGWMQLGLTGARDGYSGWPPASTCRAAAWAACPRLDYEAEEGERAAYEVEATLRNLDEYQWQQVAPVGEEEGACGALFDDALPNADLRTLAGTGLSPGADLASLRGAPSDGACCKLCAETFGCTGFVKVGADCYLKSGVLEEATGTAGAQAYKRTDTSLRPDVADADDTALALASSPRGPAVDPLVVHERSNDASGSYRVHVAVELFPCAGARASATFSATTTCTRCSKAAARKAARASRRDCSPPAPALTPPTSERRIRATSPRTSTRPWGRSPSGCASPRCTTWRCRLPGADRQRLVPGTGGGHDAHVAPLRLPPAQPAAQPQRSAP